MELPSAELGKGRVKGKKIGIQCQTCWIWKSLAHPFGDIEEARENRGKENKEIINK